MRRKLQSRNEDTISVGCNDTGEGCCRDVISLSEELRNSDNVQLLRNGRSRVRNSEGFQEVICLLNSRSSCVFFYSSGVRVCFFSPVNIALFYFPLLPGGVSLLVSISGLGLGLRLGLELGLRLGLGFGLDWPPSWWSGGGS